MCTRRGQAVLLGLLVVGLGLTACGDDDDSGDAQQASARAGVASITEEHLPEGFEKAPTVEVGGKKWRFDNVPGHYWKVLDHRGFAVGLHFQSDKPFKWAEDAPKSADASIGGRPPAGFDHWHGLVGAGPKAGHWLLHTAVRDLTLAGPPGNPMAGTKVEAGQPGFMPVCDIR